MGKQCCYAFIRHGRFLVMWLARLIKNFYGGATDKTPQVSPPCFCPLSLSLFLILLSFTLTFSVAKNCSYFKHFTSGEEAEVFEVKTQKGGCLLTVACLNGFCFCHLNKCKSSFLSQIISNSKHVL